MRSVPPGWTRSIPGPNIIVSVTDCPEKTRLLNEYSEATQQFSESVAVLQARMGTAPKDEYNRLLRLSEANRVKSEQARLNMERHVVEHGC
jgi:hypothetical protein